MTKKPEQNKEHVKNTKKTQETNEKSQEINLDNFSDLLDLIVSEKEISKLKSNFCEHLEKIINRHDISKEYLILFLYDENNSITEKMTDKIYAAIPGDNKKSILLIIHSTGGQVEPAYLISKTCKEKSSNFQVAIPRKAKSAATLISLGADTIHMGSMSELGPIDPQFGNLPALGLSSSLESIANVVSNYPKSSDMFAKYLSDKLDLRILGYFERVSESAKQYAQRLLYGKDTPKEAKDIAHALVYEYKDHNFVIDQEEAISYLGDVIKTNTPEYSMANDIHTFMSKLNLIASFVKKKNVDIVGSCNDIGFSDTPKM